MFEGYNERVHAEQHIATDTQHPYPVSVLAKLMIRGDAS